MKVLGSRSKEARREYYLRNRDKHLADTKQRYQENKEKLLEYQRTYREENRELIAGKQKGKRQARLLECIDRLGGHCRKCLKEYDPVCYDFHHTDPSTKEFTIGENMSVSKARLFAEVDKCILLCANCHRLTHKEMNIGTPAI